MRCPGPSLTSRPLHGQRGLQHSPLLVGQIMMIMHALVYNLVGNHFIILKLGQAVLDKKPSEVGLDELTELSHELQR